MDKRQWGAAVLGDRADLDQWTSVLKPPFDPWIELHREETILRSASMENLSTAGEVRDWCVACMERLNGAMALDRASKPVRLGSIVEFGPKGELHRAIFPGVVEVELRLFPGTVTVTNMGPDGKLHSPPPRPTRVQTWARLADDDELLDDALVYFGRSADWFDIYKALECLILRFGGSKAKKREAVFLSLGWAPADEISRLKRTANAARHARKRYDPPANPMSVKKAHALLGTLLRRAFDEVASNPPPRALP
ncbi:MAG TPA: hypothetical protein VMT08_30740 [Bradyrhizobium sp.]|nr:hypothetical protein [Bradyrhizobium sp.]